MPDSSLCHVHVNVRLFNSGGHFNILLARQPLVCGPRQPKSDGVTSVKLQPLLYAPFTHQLLLSLYFFLLLLSPFVLSYAPTACHYDRLIGFSHSIAEGLLAA
jgi:hypothetical protein